MFGLFWGNFGIDWIGKTNISIWNSIEFLSKIEGSCVLFANVKQPCWFSYFSKDVMRKEYEIWKLMKCIFMNSAFCCTLSFFYLFNHKGCSQVHILNLNQTWYVTQAQAMKIIFLSSRRPADHFEVPCKHLCSGWISPSLNRSVVSHVVCTFSWCNVGNKTKNILSNQVPFCRSD